MSVDVTVIEFEQRQAHLTSELDGGPPYTVHGVALGAGDVTRGASGVKKIWPADELREAAKTLEGTNLVEDHENSSRGVVGEVTKAGYKEGVGVLYEAELFDESLAEKISNGLLEVSVRGYHIDVDEMEEHEETGAKVVEDIEFDNLSVVPSGASPSNTLEMGSHAELSVEELSDYVSTLQEDEDSDEEEDAEIEPGMWVTDGDMNGVTISQVEDGEIEVDVYEESDGTWRSTGETTMVSIDSLEEWDVDEDDIGAREEEEEEDTEEAESDVEIGDTISFDEEEFEVKDSYSGTNYIIDTGEEETGWYPHHAVRPTDAEVGDEVTIRDEAYGDEEGDSGEVVEAETMDVVLIEDDEMVWRSVESEEMQSAEDYLFDSKEEAEAFIEDKDGLTGVHEMDGQWMPGADHEEFEEWQESEEAVHSHTEGGEEILDTDAARKEHSGEERNPDGQLDDEYEELQEYEFHTPEWSGTTESDWSTPDLEDFDTDNLEEIQNHFLIAEGGFPPENYGSLKLPVVEPNGDLSLNALSAVKGGRGVSAVDGLSDDMEEEIVNWVNNTASEEFDKSWGEEENAVTKRNSPGDEAQPSHRMDPEVEDDKEMEAGSPVKCALDLINLFLRQNGKDERDSVDKMLGWLFSSTDVPTEKMEKFRVEANSFLDAQGGADSFDAVDVESFRQWLLTQGGQTDDGVHARPTQPTSGSGVPRIATPVHVLSGDDLRSVLHTGASKKVDAETQDITMTSIEEELEELDEPVAVEKEDFESLQEKADQFEEMSENLDALRERTDVLDSADREQVEELADADDPVVIESEEYEELSAEAEQVKQVYAETLSGDDSPFTADELSDKFSIEELREKYEEAGHELEEELEADPQSADPSEEELEERAEEENESEEELAREEEISDKQAELREKIIGN